MAFAAKAQHYDFAATSGTFTPVNGTAVAGVQADEAVSGAIPIGFTFTYFGTAFTEVKVSSNGFLSFNTSVSPSFSNQFNGGLTRVVAPLWDDLSGSGGTATYSTTGTAGSRVFTFEWINWKWNYEAAAAGISFQVKLYETTNVVQFIYRQEGGALNSASASIGLIGVAASNRFYSLTNTSSAPGFSPTGNNSINSKPANGQIYTFTPGTGPAAPTTPASQVTATANTGKTMNLSWTNGNGTYRAVFMKQTSAVEDVTVTDGSFANSSAVFGDALYTSNWYCVYNGTGNSVSVSKLDPGLPYRIKVVEYNGLANAQKYLNTAGTNNPVAITTTLVKPVDPISTLKIYRVSGSEVSLDLTEGDGTKRVIFMKAGATTGTAPVVDNTTYTANTTFGTGSQIGATGWYCVFNGPSTFDFTVTGLSSNLDYVIHAIDYNGAAGSELYNIDTDPQNPVTFKTFLQLPLPTYTFAATTGTFTPLTGATAVANIQSGQDFSDDDELSTAIPLGFTFRFAGVPFTQLYASTNGFVSFNPFMINTTNTTFNDLESAYNRPLIAPYWDDLTGAHGSASYTTSGSAPNRVFTIEYLNWAADYTAPSAGLSFQVKLYETSNKIEFVYRKDAGALVSPSASIGLAFPNMNTGNYISLNGAGASPTASSSVETSNIATAPATGQIYSFTPAKMNQTITFPVVADKFFGSGTFTLSATSTSGLPLTYSTSNANVATVSGNVVTLTGVGSVTITASQAGDDVFNAATDQTRTFIVNKGNQTISFADPGSRQYSATTFNLTATASSGLPVSYASANTAVATISGSTVTIVGVGTTEITASQAGDATYNAATNQVRTLTITKANQTISFTGFGLKKYGDAPFAVTASASSGLPLTFTSANTSVATVEGNVVTITGAGMATVTISQAGNANYNPATYDFGVSVEKANQTITFPEITTKTIGDASFTLTATSSSGLPVTFSDVTGTTPARVSVNGNTVTVLSPGTTTIHAFQAGNQNYHSAGLSRTFCVNPAKPTVTISNLDTSMPRLEGPEGDFWYRWDKDGKEYQFTKTLDVTTPGVYTLVTYVDYCESVPSDNVSLVITGSEETKDGGVKIYPNPVMNDLIVDLTSMNEKNPVRVELVDVSGRTIHSQMASKSVTIKMEKQKAGLYMLRIEGSNKVITKQIIKK